MGNKLRRGVMGAGGGSVAPDPEYRLDLLGNSTAGNVVIPAMSTNSMADGDYVEFDFKFLAPNNGTTDYLVLAGQSGNTRNYIAARGSNNNIALAFSDGSTSFPTTSSNVWDGAWHTFKILKGVSTTVTFFVDGVQLFNTTTKNLSNVNRLRNTSGAATITELSFRNFKFFSGGVFTYDCPMDDGTGNTPVNNGTAGGTLTINGTQDTNWTWMQTNHVVPNVGSVFSIDEWVGANNQVINNIDFENEGGLVWQKTKNNTFSHVLLDTIKGGSSYLRTDTLDIATTSNNRITAFNNNGYTMGSPYDPSEQDVGWSFRNAPRFFQAIDIPSVPSGALYLAHDLGIQPSLVIIKRYTGSNSDWFVYEQGNTQADDTRYLRLNLGNGVASTSTPIVYTDSFVNFSNYFSSWSGSSAVVYMFAHDPSGVVVTGGYQGNGNVDGTEVVVGWKPQYLMIKNVSASGDWFIFDKDRGIVSGGNDNYLRANLSNAEGTTQEWLELTSNGFKLNSTHSGVNTNGNFYIYLAIRDPLG